MRIVEIFGELLHMGYAEALSRTSVRASAAFSNASEIGWNGVLIALLSDCI